MDLGLKDRVAIVGGGSKGLGRACADSLAREGANLAICSRNAEELERAAEEIRSATGVDVLAVPGDLSQLRDIQELVGRTVDRYGRLGVVIANSGRPAGRPGPLPPPRRPGAGPSTWPCTSISAWAGRPCPT